MGQLLSFPRAQIKTDPPPARDQSYLIRHHQALQNPRGPEAPIVSLRSALIQYGIEYQSRYDGCALGDDCLLGDAWLSIAKGYLVLLNGDCGRLDCGTLDGEIRQLATRFGFPSSETEAL